MTPLDRAEALLADIAEFQYRHDRMNIQYQEAHEDFERQHAGLINDVLTYEAMIEQLEGELSNLLKREKKAIFGDRDKVALKHGIIHWAKGRVLRIPRDVLETLKKLGWRDGIKILEQVNRSEIETWPDDKLSAIGAAWKEKNEYKWEVRK